MTSRHANGVMWRAKNRFQSALAALDKGGATLPAPDPGLMPTVNIAPAVGWPDGTTPQAARELAVIQFATGFDHPRGLHVLPNGDVQVAESNAPVEHDAGSGLKGFVMGIVMAPAGGGVPSADSISLLRDADGDGIAVTHTVFLENLHLPFGMALIGHALTSPIPTRSWPFRMYQVHPPPKRPARATKLETRAGKLISIS